MTTSDEPPHAGQNRLHGEVVLPQRWLWLLRGFRKYVHRYLRKHFHAVRLSKSGDSFSPAPAGPLLLVLNHPSWWDPLVCLALSERLTGRDQFAAIDAAAVERYGFFKRLGFVGVDSTSLRGAAAFIRTGLTVLSQPDRVFWVTAQGRFADVRQRPLGIQSGVGHLAARLTQGSVVPVALEYAFWNESTPEALVRIGQPIRVEGHPGRSAQEWTTAIELALTETLDGLSADAVARDPARFIDLVSGQTGVGGVYDLWRRMKSWARGRRFDPSHDLPPSEVAST